MSELIDNISPSPRPKELTKAQRIRLLEESRESVKLHLRTIHSDLENPQRLERQIERNLKQIALMQANTAILQSRLESLDKLLDDNVNKLEELNTQIKMLKHESKIETLKALANSIAQLEGQLEDQANAKAVSWKIENKV